MEGKGKHLAGLFCSFFFKSSLFGLSYKSFPLSFLTHSAIVGLFSSHLQLCCMGICIFSVLFYNLSII